MSKWDKNETIVFIQFLSLLYGEINNNFGQWYTTPLKGFCALLKNVYTYVYSWTTMAGILFDQMKK